MGNNTFSRLPPELGKLTNLRELMLSKNNLSSLPHTISQLTKLKSLSFDSRDGLKYPPKSVNIYTCKEFLELQESLYS